MPPRRSASAAEREANLTLILEASRQATLVAGKVLASRAARATAPASWAAPTSQGPEEGQPLGISPLTPPLLQQPAAASVSPLLQALANWQPQPQRKRVTKRRLSESPEGRYWCCHYPEGIAVREGPDIDASKTGEVVEDQEIFRAVEERRGTRRILYLRLADGRGWVFDRRPGTSMGSLCRRVKTDEMFRCFNRYKAKARRSATPKRTKWDSSHPLMVPQCQPQQLLHSMDDTHCGGVFPEPPEATLCSSAHSGSASAAAVLSRPSGLGSPEKGKWCGTDPMFQDMTATSALLDAEDPFSFDCEAGAAPARTRTSLPLDEARTALGGTDREAMGSTEASGVAAEGDLAFRQDQGLSFALELSMIRSGSAMEQEALEQLGFVEKTAALAENTTMEALAHAERLAAQARDAEECAMLAAHEVVKTVDCLRLERDQVARTCRGQAATISGLTKEVSAQAREVGRQLLQATWSKESAEAALGDLDRPLLEVRLVLQKEVAEAEREAAAHKALLLWAVEQAEASAMTAEQSAQVLQTRAAEAAGQAQALCQEQELQAEQCTSVLQSALEAALEGCRARAVQRIVEARARSAALGSHAEELLVHERKLCESREAAAHGRELQMQERKRAEKSNVQASDVITQASWRLLDGARQRARYWTLDCNAELGASVAVARALAAQQHSAAQSREAKAAEAMAVELGPLRGRESVLPEQEQAALCKLREQQELGSAALARALGEVLTGAGALRERAGLVERNAQEISKLLLPEAASQITAEVTATLAAVAAADQTVSKARERHEVWTLEVEACVAGVKQEVAGYLAAAAEAESRRAAEVRAQAEAAKSQVEEAEAELAVAEQAAQQAWESSTRAMQETRGRIEAEAAVLEARESAAAAKNGMQVQAAESKRRAAEALALGRIYAAAELVCILSVNKPEQIGRAANEAAAVEAASVSAVAAARAASQAEEAREAGAVQAAVVLVARAQEELQLTLRGLDDEEKASRASGARQIAREQAERERCLMQRVEFEQRAEAAEQMAGSEMERAAAAWSRAEQAAEQAAHTRAERETLMEECRRAVQFLETAESEQIVAVRSDAEQRVLQAERDAASAEACCELAKCMAEEEEASLLSQERLHLEQRESVRQAVRCRVAAAEARAAAAEQAMATLLEQHSAAGGTLTGFFQQALEERHADDEGL